MPSKAQPVLAFVFAVLLAAALGSIVQTQYNLAMLQALGAPLSAEVRLRATGLDLLGFAPLFAVLVAAGFLCALPSAAWLSRRLLPLRWPLFALAGALAIWLAMSLANALLPMPTLIGANRSLIGTLGLMACGSLGALLFARLSRPLCRP
ncbi:hypothetical protein [Pseudomonas xionganensis]|uniref:Uncharacterized protein n=1 Tax=Pseudomonas xionganensis TaxID=2654845 RepID=A0A6I4KUR3_9PSED|nr:hypothetical protein [Pseudomonas xionganensis]MVW74452.1 hypothetical protein [Pseudomonas xionganensis]